MAAGDVTLLQDGGGDGTGNAKMHPYVVALVRWCVSCVWSAATVVVHRILTTPLPITGTKHHACVKVGRAATTGHINPEPLVHCEVLRTPDNRPEVDFIFLHGLYGSLENTWRQGDWRSKYKIEPNKVPLRRPNSIPDTCACDDCKCKSKEPYKPTYKNTEECTCINNRGNTIQNEIDKNLIRNENDNINIKIENESIIVKNKNKFRTDENDIIDDFNDNDTTVFDKEMYITEGFYANNLSCDDQYGVQARFVQDLFSLETENCDKDDCDFVNKNDTTLYFDNKEYAVREDNISEGQIVSTVCDDDYTAKQIDNCYKSVKVNKKCLVKNIISKPIDLTFSNSDHIDNKCDNDASLKDLKNIHSENQIKTIDYLGQNNSVKDYDRSENISNKNDNKHIEPKFCEDLKYENINLINDNNISKQNYSKKDVENENIIPNNDEIRHENIKLETGNDQIRIKNEKFCEVGCGCICDKCYSTCWPKDWLSVDYPNARIISVNYTSDPYLWRPLWVKECKRLRLHERAEQMTEQLINLGVGERPIIWVGHSKGGLFIKQIYTEAYEAYLRTQNYKLNRLKEDTEMLNEPHYQADDSQELESLYLRSRVWSQSGGFMFYSVPHRGSPLANINTPITARSIELTEISQDCSLVLTLQDRWLSAMQPLKPAVRSLVETNRTLMAVLWLRIVSVESADAGIGALCGVSVDHREICKPSSRSCVLYTELLKLVHASLNRWRCINQ